MHCLSNNPLCRLGCLSNNPFCRLDGLSNNPFHNWMVCEIIHFLIGCLSNNLFLTMDGLSNNPFCRLDWLTNNRFYNWIVCQIIHFFHLMVCIIIHWIICDNPCFWICFTNHGKDETFLQQIIYEQTAPHKLKAFPTNNSNKLRIKAS